jgi:DNA-binding NarL/FixJ family response regulator
VPGAEFVPLDSRNHLLLADEPAWPDFLAAFDRFLGPARPHLAADQTGLDRLTTRETEVLRLVAHGLSNTGIAEQLFLSPRTVERHLSHVYDKLGLTGRAGRAAAAALIARA